VPKAAQNWVMI